MSEWIPYFAALIMILFTIAFYAALKEFKKLDKDAAAPSDSAK